MKLESLSIFAASRLRNLIYIYIYIYDREIRNGRIKIQANSLDRARLSPAGDSRGSGDLLVTVDTERSLLRVGGRSSFPA